MKSYWKRVVLIGIGIVVCTLGAGLAQGGKEAVFVDSTQAQFEEVAPGVAKTVLWGDHEKGPYGAFTRFDPGVTNALHSHANEVRIVVIRGAYLYQPQGGPERRVGPGAYLSVPGGDVHVSGGDAKEGALFYEASPGGFTLDPVEQE